MAVLLFKMNAVPEDEVNDIRALLSENEINYYETSAGNWGISVAGIWLHNKDQFTQASQLIDEYEQTRYQQARAEYEQLCAEGRQRTLLDMIKESPLRFSAYLIIIVMILYFSIKPFIGLGA